MKSRGKETFALNHRLSGNMYHEESAPPDALKESIRCFWHTVRDFGPAESDFEIMPDGYAEIIFLFGQPCSMLTGDGAQTLSSPFLMGLLDRPAVLRSTGRLEVVGIRCYPWTVFDLLGLPPRSGRVQPFQHPIAALQSLLAQEIRAGRLDGAFAILYDYFLHAGTGAGPGGMLARAGAAMRGAEGKLPVRKVARAAHATVRTLERKFKQASGHTVRDVSALMRFEQVRNRLWHEPRASLAGLAQELGYSDQAHLSREFKRYSGTSPAAFARKARTGRDALGGDFVAFVQG